MDGGGNRQSETRKPTRSEKLTKSNFLQWGTGATRTSKLEATQKYHNFGNLNQGEGGGGEAQLKSGSSPPRQLARHTGVNNSHFPWQSLLTVATKQTKTKFPDFEMISLTEVSTHCFLVISLTGINPENADRWILLTSNPESFWKRCSI